MSEAQRIVDEQDKEKKIKNQEVLGNKMMSKDGANESPKGYLLASIRIN